MAQQESPTFPRKRWPKAKVGEDVKGLTPKAMDCQRWAGVALVLGGVWLIQGGGAQSPVWTPAR